MTEKREIIKELLEELFEKRFQEFEVWFSKLQKQVDNINERTKRHTLDIQELRRMLK